jgi:serine phosphatase RsbU (regulator of sigma subunit)
MHLSITTKLTIFLVAFIASLHSVSQTYTVAFGDTINRIDQIGMKQGFWFEKISEDNFVGNYKNNIKVKGWRKFNERGDLIRSYLYRDGKIIYNLTPDEGLVVESGSTIFFKIKVRAKKNSETTPKYSENDSLILVKLNVYNQSISKRNSQSSIKKSVSFYNDYRLIDSVNIEIEDLMSSIKFKLDLDSTMKRNKYDVKLLPNKYYKFSFSKRGFLTQSILINTEYNPNIDYHIHPIEINMSNRVINQFDPISINEPSKKYKISEKGWIINDLDYALLSKILMERKNDYQLKFKILELENSVNEQILDLKEKQILIENEKKLKEEELKRIESDNKRKELELNLLEKEKSLSALVLKAKEAELIKNKALANEKKKEIENLNQQKIINELNIKNKESELIQKNIEADNRQKQIQGLEHEQILSEENLKQQKSIRNLTLIGSGLLAIFLVFVFFSLSKTRKANKLIALQQSETEKQKHLVEEKQKEIIESISYAKRLQEAILPPQAFVNAHLKNNFIYYQPKDIVAGDFYWAEKVEDKFFIAAADSTGHGVPGAMVSVVCSNALNRTIKEFKLTETGKILDKTRELVIETFEKSASEVKDGMDISILCIDSKNKNIYWSGANNPLWYIQDNELKEIKADKQPIGKSDYPKPFTTHEIEYKANTTFYLFTDGFADQFGGHKGKKFKHKQFSDLLVKNNNLSQSQQAEIINKAFSDWKGDLEQVDDVCVIGIKI